MAAIKHCFKTVTILILFTISTSDDFEKKNRFVVKLNTHYKEQIKEILEEYNFEWLFQITPETFIVDCNCRDLIVDCNCRDQAVSILEILSELYNNQISSWEHVREYTNTLKTAQAISTSEAKSVRKKKYGMEDDGKWLLNQTSKGITIAISGIGVDKDLTNMETYIRNSLNVDFAKPDVNVLKLQSFNGIKDPGIIVVNGATYHPVCSSERANSTTQPVLQKYEVNFRGSQHELQPANWTKSGIMSRALVHVLDEIDIFCNAWSTTEPFQTLDLSIQEVIIYGARKGRRKLGTIYVVPAGPPGSDLSNNIYTITVGSIILGSMPFNVDASVITSGLCEEINGTSSSVLTTLIKSKCISSFSCFSAATAKIAGTIALGLEANRNLSLRDIQHLLVQASDHQVLKDLCTFKRNGAGRMFHDVLGFGLLNASKFVNMCKMQVPVSNLLKVSLDFEHNRTFHERNLDVQLLYNCKSYEDDDCITSVEQILVSVKLKINTNNLTLAVISPAGTESVLIKEIKPDFTAEHFVTAQFWDELPLGIWTVRMQGTELTALIEMAVVSVTIYGIHRLNNVYLPKDQNHHDFAVLSVGAVVSCIIIATVIIAIFVYRFVIIHGSPANTEVKHGFIPPTANLCETTKETLQMKKLGHEDIKIHDNPETTTLLKKYDTI